MRIARLRIRNFRSIKEAEFFPEKHNVLLGQNNSGKTAILEALNLALNPEVSFRTRAIDENDFHQRKYFTPAPPMDADATGGSSCSLDRGSSGAEAFHELDSLASATKLEGNDTTSEERPSHPTIRIEVVLTDLAPDDEDRFRDHLVPWNTVQRCVVESADAGVDPFDGAQTAIRLFFEGWFDEEEDEFRYDTYLLPHEGLHRDECAKVTREQKRQIGFLIYRDFRALSRPITLDPENLFSRLLASQDVKPRHFERVLDAIADAMEPLNSDSQFASAVNAYKAELERFLALTSCDTSKLSFDLMDRTRRELRSNAQLYTWDWLSLPIQKMGAGTRSLSLLAMLTLIMRRRQRGILALEEPETFLFPHAQRRVIDECLSLADQTFITTHSPYVLERVPIDGIGRIERQVDGALRWTRLSSDSAKACNFFSRHLRSVHCEALVGCGVIIVEGDSDRWWLSGVSQLLNRKVACARQQEALELQGIAIVNGEGYGDVLPLGNFFHGAGLRVVGFIDRVEDPSFMSKVQAAPYPCVFHRYGGLEHLLACELSEAVLRQFLTRAPHAQSLPMSESAVATLSAEQLRETVKVKLRENKGAAYMHQWLIGELRAEDVPPTLAKAVDLCSRIISSREPIGACTI